MWCPGIRGGSPSNPIRTLVLVREMGLEPIRHRTHAPQTCLSTCSSTRAGKTSVIIARSGDFVNGAFYAEVDKYSAQVKY